MIEDYKEIKVLMNDALEIVLNTIKMAQDGFEPDFEKFNNYFRRGRRGIDEIGREVDRILLSNGIKSVNFVDNFFVIVISRIMGQKDNVLREAYVKNVFSDFMEIVDIELKKSDRVQVVAIDFEFFFKRGQKKVYRYNLPATIKKMLREDADLRYWFFSEFIVSRYAKIRTEKLARNILKAEDYEIFLLNHCHIWLEEKRENELR